MVRLRNNIFLCISLCLLCGCSKQNASISGTFGFDDNEVISTESDEEKYAIKDDITLSTEEIVESSETEISLNNLQEEKLYEIEQNLKSNSTEVTEEDVVKLLSTSDFENLSDFEKENLATKVVDRINVTSETLSSELVYKHASSYVTDEIIIDKDAPSRVYSEEELAIMHSEAEELYQKQQVAETFDFDD